MTILLIERDIEWVRAMRSPRGNATMEVITAGTFDKDPAIGLWEPVRDPS